jgi:hypothetical protein
MLTTDPQTLVDLANFLGSALGATGAALVPYWQTIRQNEALGLPPITFDKKFTGTLLMALVIGFAIAFTTFTVSPVTLTTNQSLVSVFIVAAVSAVTANRWLNSYLAVSPVTKQVVELKKDNEQLKDELSLVKLKVASLKHPIMDEVLPPTAITLPIAEKPDVVTTTVIAEGGEVPPVST